MEAIADCIATADLSLSGNPTGRKHAEAICDHLRAKLDPVTFALIEEKLQGLSATET